MAINKTRDKEGFNSGQNDIDSVKTKFTECDELNITCICVDLFWVWGVKLTFHSVE